MTTTYSPEDIACYVEDYADYADISKVRVTITRTFDADDRVIGFILSDDRGRADDERVGTVR